MFGSLEMLPLRAFIDEERGDDHLLMFFHVLKTAGSAFGNELARARRPYPGSAPGTLCERDFRQRDLPPVRPKTGCRPRTNG